MPVSHAADKTRPKERARNQNDLNGKTPSLSACTSKNCSNELFSLLNFAIGVSVTFISLGIFSLSYLWTLGQSCWDVFVHLRRADFHKFCADFLAYFSQSFSNLTEFASKIYLEISSKLNRPRELDENGPFYALSILPYMAYSAVIIPMDTLIWKPFLSLSSSMRNKICEMFFSFIAIAIVIVLVIVRSWFMLITWFILGSKSDSRKNSKTRDKNHTDPQSRKYYTQEFDISNYNTFERSQKADTVPNGARFRSKSQVLQKSPFLVQSQQNQDSEFISTQLECPSQEELVKSSIDQPTLDRTETAVKLNNEPLNTNHEKQSAKSNYKTSYVQDKPKESTAEPPAPRTMKQIPKRRAKPRRRHRPVQDIFPQKMK